MIPEKNDEIIIIKEIKAPKKLVWDTWTKAEYIKDWMAPEGMTTRVEKQDFKEGGRFRYVMIGPDGKEYPSEGEYKKIIPEEQIESTDEFGEDFDAGEIELPKIKLTTIQFKENDNTTKILITVLHKTPEDKTKHEKMGVRPGWESTLKKFEECVLRRI